MKYFDFDFDLSQRREEVSVSVLADFCVSDLNSRGKILDKTNIVYSSTSTDAQHKIVVPCVSDGGRTFVARILVNIHDKNGLHPL